MGSSTVCRFPTVTPRTDPVEIRNPRREIVGLEVTHRPPEGVGKFILSPHDGRLVLVDRMLFAQVGVEDGLRLGPLPVGGHTFELSAGGEQVGDRRSRDDADRLDPTPATADTEAGELGLHVPLLHMRLRSRILDLCASSSS